MFFFNLFNLIFSVNLSSYVFEVLDIEVNTKYWALSKAMDIRQALMFVVKLTASNKYGAHDATSSETKQTV